MSWQDRLLPGSFRDVPFKARSASLATGRRVVSHEVPLQDELVHQDLGLANGALQFVVAVLGPNFMDERDALRAALEKPGPGILVHPELGTMRVVIGEVKLTHETTEGGVAVFTITARRADLASETSTPRRVLVERVGRLGDAVEAAALDEFERTTQVAGVPGWTLEAAVDEVRSVLDAIRNLGLGGLAEQGAELARDVERLADGALDRMANPRGLGASLQDTIRGVRSAITSRTSAFRALRGLIGQAPAVSSGKSLMQGVAQKNAQAVQNLASATALSQASAAAADASWASRDDALAALDEARSLFDAVRQTATDELVLELDALEASLVAVLPPPGADLPHLETLVLDETVPALVLSHRLYGTPDRADELVGRNRVRHPGFVPAGQPLEVLARG